MGLYNNIQRVNSYSHFKNTIWDASDGYYGFRYVEHSGSWFLQAEIAPGLNIGYTIDKGSSEESQFLQDKPNVRAYSNTRPVTVSGTITSSECVSNLKYERMDDHDLPKESQGFDVVHTITGPAVFYKMLFEVDSDHIYIQVTIDGDDVFPAGDGFKLEELEDMQLGTGGNSGYYSYGGSGNSTGNFDIFQYAPNRWVWVPPDPLCIDTSLQVKMKSSDSETSRDLQSGIIVWRAL